MTSCVCSCSGLFEGCDGRGNSNVYQKVIKSLFFGPKLLKFRLSANCARSSADKTGYWWIFRTHFLPACRQIQESNFAFPTEMPTPLRKLWEDVLILHCPGTKHEVTSANMSVNPPENRIIVGLVDISTGHAKNGKCGQSVWYLDLTTAPWRHMNNSGFCW